jgi:pimeloyl-ACP methyl ester carboxylesterase
VEGRFVETNGVRLYCRVAGSGPVVLLLHGFPETSHAWRHQIDALAPHFRVVAPDLRGYGSSDKPPGIAAYRREVLGTDVLGLIHAFDAERAHVVGHDWGGGVAWTFAMQHPDALDRLAVINCPHPVPMAKALRSNWRQIRRSWYIFAFQIPWLPEWALTRDNAHALREALRRSAKRGGTFAQDDLDAYARAFAASGAATAAINYYRAAFRQGARVRGPRITAPTLLIWGEDDVALGKELTYGMDDLFAGELRIEYLSDTSHWVMEERPAEVNRLLLDFLAR